MTLKTVFSQLKKRLLYLDNLEIYQHAIDLLQYMIDNKVVIVLKIFIELVTSK
jgi:hypothetical protein